MHSEKSQIGNWLSDSLAPNCFATITFKQCKHHDGGVREWINAEIAQTTCNELMLRCARHMKKLIRAKSYDHPLWATFIENGHGEKRLHAHMAINLPTVVSFEDFSRVFGNLCARFDWIDDRIDIKNITVSEDRKRVIFYCLKEGVDAFQPNASRLVPN